MSTKVLTRCRCAETHTSIHSYVHCAFPHARITGSGKYALITRCGLTTVQQHTTAVGAYTAKATTTCAARCRGAHEVVRLSPNPHHNEPKTHPAASHTANRFSH